LAIRIAQNASVSDAAKLSENASIWDFAQVRENATIGKNTIIGSYAYIDANVQIGNNCKVQNRAHIYDPAIIHDGVFIGPGVILSNDKNPRAINQNGLLKGGIDWEKCGVEIFEGATIGAGSICVAPIKIGKWALVGAGSTVVSDVKNFALVLGAPARQVGWVGKAGFKLKKIGDDLFECPKSSQKYKTLNSELFEIEG
jgi:acetyltransferase-like isoleucine patch superfamily enzyme